LSELLPEQVSVMTPEQKDITLKQLLTMTGGVTGSATGLDVQAGDPVETILTYGMDSEPGTIFGYSDASAHLVATALRRAIARPILDYAREKLFDPLGIVTRPAWEGSNRFTGGGFDDAGFGWLVDSTGVHGGGYGLRLTARDLVKIGQLYLDGGRWQGRRLVPESWVRESTSNQLTPEQGHGDRYGYFWWVIDEPDVSGFMAAGSFNQVIFVVPARRLVVVTTANDTGYAESAIAADFEPLMLKTVLEPLVK
ncbi:MAG TPA: serine hydrolase, partial [Microlunatus sp.]|nr:serine hydrolase [Microlunatus sp.]